MQQQMKNRLKQRGKKGSWIAKIWLNGQPKWITLGIMPSYQDAARALASREAEIQRNFGQDIKRITFEKMAQAWLENKKLDMKPHTFDSYRLEVNSHLVPFFGKMQISKILPGDIERFKQQMGAKKIQKGVVKKGDDGIKRKIIIETDKTISTTTVNYDLRILRQILETANRWGYLHANAAKKVKPLKQKKRQFQTLTLEEAHRLVNAAEGQMKVFLMIAVQLGPRVGELLAMRWKNLDVETRFYTFRESYSNYGFDTPKTDSSVREVEVPKDLLETIRTHKAEQNQIRLMAGDLWSDNDLVFTTPIGTPLDPSHVRRVYRALKKKAGIPKTIRFHDLRATAATLALEAGADIKAVQHMLGHTSPNLTLQIYARVTGKAKHDLAQKIGDYFATLIPAGDAGSKNGSKSDNVTELASSKPA